MGKVYLFLFMLLVSSRAIAQIYITQTGSGSKNGSSWNHSYDQTQLQQAINEAEIATIKQVWVAKGTYKPTEKLDLSSTDDRDVAFILKPGVEVYGGFAGNEDFVPASITNRIFTANETIMSGDLNNSNSANAGDSYHVVSARDDARGAILDGFTIQHGYGELNTTATIDGGRTIGRNVGAGISIHSNAHVTFKNLLVKENKTTYVGGGVSLRAVNSDAKFDFVNVIFQNNDAIGGGGMYSVAVAGTPSVNLTTCTFKSNNSGNTGGAHYYMYSGMVNMIDTHFENGTSTGQAGAFFMSMGITNIKNSRFIGNSTTSSGGAIFNYYGELNISKSKFYSNTSSTGPGAINGSSNNASPYQTSVTNVDNSVFYNNVSNATGVTGSAAIYTNTRATSSVTNSTFYQNKTASSYGTISFHNVTSVTVKLYNNIFNGNLATYSTTPTSVDVSPFNTAVLDYRNNLFQNFNQASSGDDIFTDNILEANPSRLFASVVPSDLNFLHLVEGAATQKGSNALAISAGITAGVSDVVSSDMAGNLRISHGTIDLGAYEYHGVLPVTINSFTANLVNGRTQLKWSVGTEDNVNRYEVERSQNGTDFITVAEVLANASSSYSTTDARPPLGANYYRLKTVDNDGSYSHYAEILSVNLASIGTEGIRVYPNPARGTTVSIFLSGYSVGVYGYKLLNAWGSIVQQGTLTYTGAVADLVLSPAISKGIYVLGLDNGTQTIRTKLIR